MDKVFKKSYFMNSDKKNNFSPHSVHFNKNSTAYIFFYLSAKKNCARPLKLFLFYIHLKTVIIQKFV